jgi:hypothetical protein
MAGTERMSDTDKLRVIKKVEAADAATLRLVWSDGTAATLDLSETLRGKAFAPLRNASAFAQVTVGDWGHSITWPCGAEMGADKLWPPAMRMHAAFLNGACVMACP